MQIRSEKHLHDARSFHTTVNWHLWEQQVRFENPDIFCHCANSLVQLGLLCLSSCDKQTAWYDVCKFFCVCVCMRMFIFSSQGKLMYKWSILNKKNSLRVELNSKISKHTISRLACTMTTTSVHHKPAAVSVLILWYHKQHITY